MQIEHVELDFVQLPLKAPFQTSFGTDVVKSTWVVTVLAEGIRGYAESVADVEPLYNEETHASEYFCWKNSVLPRLAGQEIDTPEQVDRLLEPVRGNRMAKAAIEMAIWDWFARSQELPLWKLLGGDARRSRIPVGVSIGIQPSANELIAAGLAYLDQGYRRLKVKIKPGLDVAPLTALREAVGPDVLIMADANSAYQLRDIDTLKALEPLNLMMLEQPLAEDDMIDHAALARELTIPICLDEAIRSDEDARKALELGACRIINIKVGRVGGHSVARRVHDVAARHQAPVWCGGMLETGIGRAHNLHLSTLPNFLLPGDTSASDRYFAEDLIDPPFQLNADGTLTVPTGPGIGVTPNTERLKRFSTHHESWQVGQRWIGGGIPHGDPTSF
ncbi:MAG: o-succinylbenzoate synthase [Sulfobacillus acidophilus]|uniref:o-succinylbenzoate synthase n=1 Tax=Sulfobacillus acidophilus TaxID=53633 RepID=A0A2T2WJB6_9FIRM|nr:MAG: o-succinylbenzoate synthase [Sulfobacillus acidophilus]